MKTRNHLRRTLLLPTLLLALLPPCACTDDICPDTAPLPGADSEATASLIGQPIQIGCIATSVEQQSPMAGEGGAQTRADGTTGTPATETGFPKVGTTITVFMTVPVRSSSAADGSSAEVRYSHANYTCTSVSTDGGTQAVTSATWQPTDPANLLRWEKAAAYYFAAISPAIEMQPLEALTYTGSDGNSGGSYALQTGEAFTFQLPQAFTPENYAYWEQLRTSGLAVRIPQPTADPIPLQMQRALVKVDIFSTASAAVLLKAPAKAVFCAYTGGVTALREAPIVSNSTDGIHSYLFVDKLTDTRSVTTLSRDGAAVHRALMIPTYHQYSPDYLPPNGPTCSEAGGNGALSFLTDKVYSAGGSIGSSSETGSVTGGTTGNRFYLPGKYLQVSDGSTDIKGTAPENILLLDGTEASYNAVKSRLEAINAAGSSSPPTLVSKLFISGSVPEGMDQSELLGLLGSSHNYVQNLYMEPVKEVPTNWYLFTNGNSTLQSINLPQATKIGYNAFNKCTGLTSIDLPKVTEIGNRAFAGCTGLTSINLPQVTNIGIGAFVGCGKLASIYLPQVTDIREDAFFGCTGLKSIVLSGTGTENSFALPTYDTQNGLGNYNFSPENLFLTGVTALEDDQITQCRTWGKMTWANIYYNYKGSPSLAEATITELTNPENYTKVTDK
ncbi:leucine-rich repeat domain-containing protein [Bacteroides uniformis]|uniref:leucine-rich repeat domain-containing protein n=1 Tax=Bacteroides uniformis TaxID=820 RepID=UPI001106128C|nr:leucine-rich repeat domain-containing protein [Bacteroides uniformis]MDC1839097.1 leucine-rich repeat domain-containing protein [Bacteroides uniformis]MDC1863502.1 leucine-rich repeat domain-containing protein [Bacteroides uniformis]MDC1867981.1 leucine-rich repeat domain-containing protein [Bacteroides uniformis]